MAAFNKLLRAQARPTSTASFSVAAFTTLIATVLVEPSASASNWSANEPHTFIRMASKSESETLTPLAPDAMKSTVSFVDVQPSESIRLYVRSVTR